jgi:hypothetical protein
MLASTGSLGLKEDGGEIVELPGRIALTTRIRELFNEVEGKVYPDMRCVSVMSRPTLW